MFIHEKSGMSSVFKVDHKIEDSFYGMRYLLFSIGLLLCACSAQKYTASDFDTITADHEMVAVLPVEMVFTGKQPKDLTEEDIHNIEVAESKAFQISLQNALLDKASDKRIHFQEIEQSNKLLLDNDLSIRESWSMPGDTLAGLLGVEAVVRMRVKKKRYMSNLASFGIDVAEQILEKMADASHWLPYNLNKTNDINSKATLINGEDGKILWNLAVDRAADWSRPPREIIDGITRKCARNFPYERDRSDDVIY